MENVSLNVALYNDRDCLPCRPQGAPIAHTQSIRPFFGPLEAEGGGGACKNSNHNNLCDCKMTISADDTPVDKI